MLIAEPKFLQQRNGLLIERFFRVSVLRLTQRIKIKVGSGRIFVYSSNRFCAALRIFAALILSRRIYFFSAGIAATDLVCVAAFAVSVSVIIDEVGISRDRPIVPVFQASNSVLK